MDNRRWSKTRTPLLWKRSSGDFFARVKVAGKDQWQSLETTVYEVAKAKLPEAVLALRGAPNRNQAPTLKDALQNAIDDLKRDPDRKPRTLEYYEALVPTITKTFPDPEKRLDKVTKLDVETWRAAHGKQFKPSRTNGALVLLRKAFRVGVESGFISADPSRDVKRRKIIQQEMTIPSRDEFKRLVEHVRAQKKRHSAHSADAIEFMAYTGLRKEEARAVRWKDIGENSLRIRTLKNDEFRTVPLIGAAKELLERMRANSPCKQDEKVLAVMPRESLSNACDAIGIAHLRIHDLRHLFATRCLESGVDLSTVAKWLGHKDKGLLAAKIYGHITEDHSSKQAANVRV
jgi:integrase